MTPRIQGPEYALAARIDKAALDVRWRDPAGRSVTRPSGHGLITTVRRGLGAAAEKLATANNGRAR